MSFRAFGAELAPFVSLIKTMCHPDADVVILVRNDKTDDQCLVGTRADIPDTAAFLQRAAKRLRTQAKEEGLLVVDHLTNKVVAGGDA